MVHKYRNLYFERKKDIPTAFHKFLARFIISNGYWNQWTSIYPITKTTSMLRLDLSGPAKRAIPSFSVSHVPVLRGRSSSYYVLGYFQEVNPMLD